MVWTSKMLDDALQHQNDKLCCVDCTTLKPKTWQIPETRPKTEETSPKSSMHRKKNQVQWVATKGKRERGQAPNWKPTSWAKRENSSVLRTQLTGVLSRKSCSSTWQCRQRDGCYLQDSKNQKLQNEQEERGFAHLLLRTRTFTYPSKTLSVLKEACQVFRW